jgi:hydroxymethylglutaryl-CoA lyase
MRNQRQTPAEALAELRRILAVGLNVTVYLSMAFGNPYGDAWSHEQVVAAAKQIEAMGVTSISLADTVGIADAARISSVCGLVTTEFPKLEIGGFGGCPFAQDERIGNLDTITVLETLGQGTTHLNHLSSRAAALAASAS